MERIELANIRREYAKELLSAIRTYNRVLEISFTAANQRIIAMLEEEIVHMAAHPEYTGHPKGVEGIVEAWMEEIN